MSERDVRARRLQQLLDRVRDREVIPPPVQRLERLERVNDRLKMADGLRKGLASYGDAGFSLFLRKAFIKAMGYSDEQRHDLEETINASDADLVLIATPIDLRKVCRIDKPAVRAYYELEDHTTPPLDELIFDRLGLRLMENV